MLSFLLSRHSLHHPLGLLRMYGHTILIQAPFLQLERAKINVRQHAGVEVYLEVLLENWCSLCTMGCDHVTTGQC